MLVQLVVHLVSGTAKTTGGPPREALHGPASPRAPGPSHPGSSRASKTRRRARRHKLFTTGCSDSSPSQALWSSSPRAALSPLPNPSTPPRGPALKTMAPHALFCLAASAVVALPATTAFNALAPSRILRRTGLSMVAAPERLSKEVAIGNKNVSQDAPPPVRVCTREEEATRERSGTPNPTSARHPVQHGLGLASPTPPILTHCTFPPHTPLTPTHSSTARQDQQLEDRVEPAARADLIRDGERGGLRLARRLPDPQVPR